MQNKKSSILKRNNNMTASNNSHIRQMVKEYENLKKAKSVREIKRKAINMLLVMFFVEPFVTFVIALCTESINGKILLWLATLVLLVITFFVRLHLKEDLEFYEMDKKFDLAKSWSEHAGWYMHESIKKYKIKGAYVKSYGGTQKDNNMILEIGYYIPNFEKTPNKFKQVLATLEEAADKITKETSKYVETKIILDRVEYSNVTMYEEFNL